ncbi:MAG: ABC transporter C-terminal domain-containing protein, partial [Phycisphaerae bacterium]
QKKTLAAKTTASGSTTQSADSPQGPPQGGDSPPPAPAAKKKLSYMEQREFAAIEDKVVAAEQEVEQLQKEMEAAVNNPADARKLEAICAKLHTAQEQVQQLYARWQELESKRG